jgi:hypothetical protein
MISVRVRVRRGHPSPKLGFQINSNDLNLPIVFCICHRATLASVILLLAGFLTAATYDVDLTPTQNTF